MNETQAVVPQAKREVRVVQDDSQVSYLMDTSRFEHCYRIAGAMARASLIPKHLKGADWETTQANCFLVVNQALRWGLDPFAVAPETYEVGGKLGFQGKLVAAVINARGGLEDKLSYTFNDAKGDALEITVSGKLIGEDLPRTITAKVGDCRTPNQMWTKDPYQKLVYTGAIKWARRHKPEVILGVLTDDDAERIRQEERESGKVAVIGKSPDFSGPAPVVDIAPAEAATPRQSRRQKREEAKPVEVVPPAATSEPLPVESKPDPRVAAATDMLPALRMLLLELNYTEKQILNLCEKRKKWSTLGEGDVAQTLEQLPAETVANIHKHLSDQNSPLHKEVQALAKE